MTGLRVRTSQGDPTCSLSKEGIRSWLSIHQLAADITGFSIFLGFFDLKIASEFCGLNSHPFYEALMSRYGEIKKATAEVVDVRVVTRTSTAKAHAAIRDVIIANPHMSYQKIAEMLGCSRWLVYRVAVEFDVKRPRGAGSPARHKGEQ